MSSPCDFDLNNPDHRKEMATIMAGHIENGGVRNYTQFVNAAKKEFSGRLVAGQELPENLVDMYEEASKAYNRRLDSSFIKEIAKIPGVNSIDRKSVV